MHDRLSPASARDGRELEYGPCMISTTIGSHPKQIPTGIFQHRSVRPKPPIRARQRKFAEGPSTATVWSKLENRSATPEGFATSGKRAALKGRAEEIPVAVEEQGRIGSTSVTAVEGVQNGFCPDPSPGWGKFINHSTIRSTLGCDAVEIATRILHQADWSGAITSVKAVYG